MLRKGTERYMPDKVASSWSAVAPSKRTRAKELEASRSLINATIASDG